VKFGGPVILASGILDETPKTLSKVATFGPGAVVTKSIGSEARQGNVNPVLIQAGEGLINSMGLPNPGIDEFIAEFDGAEDIGVPVILSIFGKSPEEFAQLAARANGHGFAGLELNLSCPNATGLGQEIGQDPARVRQITADVKAASDLPVWVKLTPNITDIRPLAMAAQEGGADAIVAINTIKAMAIDPYAKCPVIGNIMGGLSGPPIKPVGLRMVWEIYAQEGFDTPIIGCGGIRDFKDVVEYMLAGATAVEVGTALYEHGPGVIGEINKGLEHYLQKEGPQNLSQLVGLAHRRV
jgi:dihydroorotate dehydrogenase (NAD+) catalytic subunit